MFAVKSRAKVASSVVLIAVLLFNTFIPTTVSAGLEDTNQTRKISEIDSKPAKTAKDTKTTIFPVFERPTSKVKESPRLNESSLVQTSDVLIQCVSDTCTDTTPRVTLSEFQDVYGNAGANYKIICTGTNCAKRDVYYRVSVVAMAEDPWGPGSPWAWNPSLYARNAANTADGSGALRPASCPSVYAWVITHCNYATAGKIAADILSGNPNDGFHFSIQALHGLYITGVWARQTLKTEVSLVPFGDQIPADSANCPNCNYGQAQGSVGDPINTNTGVLSYTIKDLELQTSAGLLTFKRIYVSSWTSKFTSPLGNGWVHNQDIRLMFPGTNQPSFVYFKDPSGNLYQFWYVKNNTTGAEAFTPYAGFPASLIQNAGTPVTYTLRDQAQNVYIFDQSGKLVSLTNPSGQTFAYTYDTNGRLDRVSADSGSHYLEFHYDTQNRLTSVNDQTVNRFVSFHYDANGDLDSFQDVLGQTWHYEYLNHLLTRVADPSNNTVERNEYYADGRTSKQFDGEGHKTVELQYTSNNPLPAPTQTFDFESGTLSGWTVVSGTAFTSASVTNDMYWGNHPAPFLQQGTYHLLGSKANGDGAVGTLRSETVTLPERASVRLLVSGHSDINNL